VDGARHQLFARPRFPFDQHGGRDGRDLLDLHQHFLDRGRFAEDAGALLQAPPLDEPPHGRRDFVRIRGLYEPCGESQLAPDLTGILVGRLDQAQR